MNKSFLQFEYSAWWVLLIIVLAAALSYALYSKKNAPWNQQQNLLLSIIRFFAIFAVAILLLEPSIRQVKNTIEKPVVALAIDNSMSATARGATSDSLFTALDQIKVALENADLEMRVVTHDDSLSFLHRSSNISQLLDKTKETYGDQNLVSIILASDGIYNRGISPIYKNYIQPITTLGLGDTIPSKDISITRTLYNKVSFAGNDTPIRLEISQTGFDRQEVQIELSEQGKIIDQQKIRLNQKVQEVEFVVKSEREGLRRLVAKVSGVSEESTAENNFSNIFMEVIDGQKKVLIVAAAPHPDIKAIRATLSKTGNYRTDIYIPDLNNEKPNEIFDVVIFHGAFTSGINYSPKENPGYWYIMSNQSAITSLNKNLPYLTIDRRGSRPDKVAGSFNQSFSKFKIEDFSAFEDYPPIEVPFGEYAISGPTEVLMYQKLGSIVTEKPLMIVYDDGSQKSAVLAGQNIWQWKLLEAAINGNSDQFDNLITKTIQFLSVKNDKKQFRFAVRERNVSGSEPALFDVEVYNDIYERIYNNEIDIEITSESGEIQRFTFSDSEYNGTFKSPSLAPGIYQYEATTSIGDKIFADRGEFSVQSINPEFISLTANHQLLKSLSEKTGGEHFHFNQSEELIDHLIEKDFKGKIKSDETLVPLLESLWWYVLIFVLFSTEWILRKYWGGY